MAKCKPHCQCHMQTHLSPFTQVLVQNHQGSLTEIFVREEASAASQHKPAHCSVQVCKVSLLDLIPDAGKDAGSFSSLWADGATSAQAVWMCRIVRLQTMQRCLKQGQGVFKITDHQAHILYIIKHIYYISLLIVLDLWIQYILHWLPIDSQIQYILHWLPYDSWTQYTPH